MCSKKDFDTCKQNYYDVGFKSITQRYDQKIAALKKESADYQRRLQELEEERDRIMDNLRNSADAMARIDQSELDDAMQEVLDLYERGEVEESMQKLEDMKLEEKFIKTLDKKHEGERIVAEATEDSLLTLNKLRTSVDMYKNNGNWDKAAKTLKLLADKLNTYDDVFAYAYFCQGQNDFKESEIYYRKALAILDKRIDRESNDYFSEKAALLNNLANLYSNTQRFTESEKMYMEALEIRRRLAKDNPKANEPYVAITQYNIGFLMLQTEKYADAIHPFEEALEIYRRVAKNNPAQQQWYISSLYYLSALYGQQGDKQAAYKTNQELLPLLKEMYQKDADEVRSDYAGKLGDQSFYTIFMKQYAEAEQLAREEDVEKIKKMLEE